MKCVAELDVLLRWLMRIDFCYRDKVNFVGVWKIVALLWLGRYLFEKRNYDCPFSKMFAYLVCYNF